MREMRNQRAEPRNANEKSGDRVRERAKNERDIWNNELTKCNKRCPNKNILSCCLFSLPMSHDNVPCSVASHTLNIIGFNNYFSYFFFHFLLCRVKCFVYDFHLLAALAHSFVRSFLQNARIFLLLLICQIHFLGHFAFFVSVQIRLRVYAPVYPLSCHIICNILSQLVSLFLLICVGQTTTKWFF